MKQKTAKLFINGGSQAVRLPSEFRFDLSQVFIRRDEKTGDVILSTRPNRSWAEYMELRDKIPSDPDIENFLSDREQSIEVRDPFSDWVE